MMPPPPRHGVGLRDLRADHDPHAHGAADTRPKHARAEHARAVDLDGGTVSPTDDRDPDGLANAHGIRLGRLLQEPD